MKSILKLAIALMLVFGMVGCRHTTRQVRRSAYDSKMLKLTKDQAFEQGEAQFARRRYQKARTFYTYVYETFPNDPLGRRSLLRVADTFYSQGDAVNLVEAQYKYRDFINRFPGSDRADYAMLQIANVAYKQMEKPDRDQQKTREAVDKYNEMLKTYPKSPLVAEAESRRAEANDRLAKHEHIVARFYMKRKTWESAVRRLNGLVENYPGYSDRPAVYYDLGESLSRLGRGNEARLYFERLVTEFPESAYTAKAKKRMESKAAKKA